MRREIEPLLLVGWLVGVEVVGVDVDRLEWESLEGLVVLVVCDGDCRLKCLLLLLMGRQNGGKEEELILTTTCNSCPSII